ncbi:hypothetical protein [Flavobacterium silvaticum]|uniref:Uncharacterized protein n=1 Tax=Flavobacterium silvaticum TaxID=1852020 RepID=A0A972FNT6_9FLAO|nr:hypothetical protein [Flavobacterium silvaticum]NMH29118.1 hypothetical protein [Flavobacterium silvaticum]
MKAKTNLLKRVALFVCAGAALLLMAFTCDDDLDRNYVFYNHSGEMLYLYENYATDSIMPADLTTEPGRTVSIDELQEEHFADINFSDGKKLDLLIFKKSTVDLYGWPTIREQNIYDKRFFISLDSLTQLDYKVKYYGD